MKTPLSNRRSALKSCFVTLSLLVVSVFPVLADHDHPHLSVTLIDYRGYNSNSEHFEMEVKATFDGSAYYFILHFTDPKAKSFKGHEGEKVEISLSKDGKKWERARLRNHSVIQIHSKITSKRS